MFPLEWAKKSALFEVSLPGDLFWSPRVALIAGLAIVSCVVMYQLARLLSGVERSAVTELAFPT